MNNTIAPAADPVVLQQLAAAIYATDRPLDAAQRSRMIQTAAIEIAGHMPTPMHLVMQAYHFQRIRETLIAQWAEQPFEVRMGLREMAIAISGNEQHLQDLEQPDLDALIEAMPEEARALFWFSRTQNLIMLNTISTALDGDDELREVPTSNKLWNIIKRLDPRMQEALHTPLDRTAYVDRDLSRTPRRNTH
jgi:hypothetical protein